MTDENWRKARKKPLIVDFRGPYDDPAVVETIEGDYEIDDEYLDDHGGYYLIQGVEGEVYPCGADIFDATYDELPTITDSFRCVDCGTERSGSSSQILYRKVRNGDGDPTYVPERELCEECS